MRVHKVDHSGKIALTYEAKVEEWLADGVRLAAQWGRPAMELGYVTFEMGDCFTEWYYSDRWYNIFEIASPDGTLKGWYCNAAAPASIEADDLYCRDLILDLWVTPDGETTTLDEDEFATTALDDASREGARAGLAELQRLVAGRQGPFARLGES
jgi:predicted RNA-binding protein associated with RNAse of E/G family